MKPIRRLSSLVTVALLAFTLSLAPLALGLPYLQPVVFTNLDEFGNANSNLITVSAWPATNSLVGNGGNIISSVSYTFQPTVGGVWSNNMVPGNYRLQVSNYTAGIIFGVYSNASPIVISQVAGIPVTTFQNFTLSQFTDAGTMARESTNNWLRPIAANIVSALAFQPATNGGPVATAQLTFQPATNATFTFTGTLTYTNGSGSHSTLYITNGLICTNTTP